MGKQTDLSGKQYGRLTVLCKAEGKEDRYFRWKCLCECGNTVIVNTKKLNRGTISDCGCRRRNRQYNGPIAEDLTGQIFGQLRVLYRIDNKNGRPCWMCQCTCGQKKAVSAQMLKKGSTKSCGCLSHKKFNGFSDIQGQQIGDITVLEPTEKRDYKGSVMWNCRCKCGKEFLASSDALLHGRRRSCGCFKEEWTSEFGQQNYLTFVDGTCVEWLKNRKHRSDNTSGFRGVSRTQYGSYRVSIGFRGKRYYCGSFCSFPEAVNARLNAEQLLHEQFVKQYEEWQEHAKNDAVWAESHPFRFVETSEVKKNQSVV